MQQQQQPHHHQLHDLDNNTDFGGGMYSDFNSSPTIRDCTFSYNAADSFGGGLSCDNSSPAIIGCTFSDNYASSGGGIFCLLSNPIITHCMIEDNTANSAGGGIHCSPSAAPPSATARSRAIRPTWRRDIRVRQQPHHQPLHDRGQHSQLCRRRDLLRIRQQPHHQPLHDRGQHSQLCRRRDLLRPQQQPHHQRLYHLRKRSRSTQWHRVARRKPSVGVMPWEQYHRRLLPRRNVHDRNRRRLHRSRWYLRKR